MFFRNSITFFKLVGSFVNNMERIKNKKIQEKGTQTT